MNPVVGQLCGPEQGLPHAIPEVGGADDLALECGKEPAIKGASIQERFSFSDYKVFFEDGHEVLGEIYPSLLSPFGCVRHLACREIALDPQTPVAQGQIFGP